MDEYKKRNLIRIAIMLAAAAMIVYGISAGEPSIVLRKAIKVCLECIGLG